MPSGWTFLIAGAGSFLLSSMLTRAMIWLAPKIGFVDKPGHRKIHANPKPLGGGVAIFWSFALLLGIGLCATLSVKTSHGGSILTSTDDPAEFAEKLRATERQHFLLPGITAPLTQGVRQQAPLLIGFLLATLCMHVMGLIDDKRALGPYSKLIVQLAVTTALVVTMEVLAQHTPSLRLRVLTTLDSLGAGAAPSIILTVLWIVAITNAFNFLDNMDGLSAGIAAVCAISFLIAAISIGQLFVAATLTIFIGSLLGFLCWNFPPSKIFMGDSGSLVVGFILGVLTVRTTFLPPNAELAAGWWTVLAPIVVLAVPLYDLIVVSMIRMSRGKSPFQGDTNHFSHRLVARGMSRRTAVLCIYLVTASTSIAAVLLPQVRTTFAAMLIFGQTILVLGVVLLLEQHPLPMPHEQPTKTP